MEDYTKDIETVVTNKDIVQLKKVIDPELGVDIVSIGLIYKVEVKKKQIAEGEHYQVYILMTLTTPGCPLLDVIESNIKSELDEIEGLDGYRDVEIELTFDPPWLIDMMSEEAKAELGF